LGRTVADFDETEWRRERIAVVVQGSVYKFGQNPELAKYLAGTTERVLVEASPVDRVWGTGLAGGDERSADPSQWPGENLLGFALMTAREVLADDSAHIATGKRLPSRGEGGSTGDYGVVRGWVAGIGCGELLNRFG
jgi:hypothetical protein